MKFLAAASMLLLSGVHQNIILRRSFLGIRPSIHDKALLSNMDDNLIIPLEEAVRNRYACKKFRRFDRKESDGLTASEPDPTVIKIALHCLDLARQAPSAYNTQPYKLLMVKSSEQKLLMSRYCLGPNAARVLDSDCTVVFLADRQVLGSLSRLIKWNRERRPDRVPKRLSVLKMILFVSVFSSGYPCPRILAAPISFLVRTSVSIMNLLIGRFYPLPTLANAETWSSKQVLMVAMTYMLACSSYGIATIPMEGINAGGIRRVLQIPGRYSIPIIVSAGTSWNESNSSARQKESELRRYPIDDIVYEDIFGGQVQLKKQ